jgi:hypothetical protein
LLQVAFIAILFELDGWWREAKIMVQIWQLELEMVPKRCDKGGVVEATIATTPIDLRLVFQKVSDLLFIPKVLLLLLLSIEWANHACFWGYPNKVFELFHLGIVPKRILGLEQV